MGLIIWIFHLLPQYWNWALMRGMLGWYRVNFYSVNRETNASCSFLPLIFPSHLSIDQVLWLTEGAVQDKSSLWSMSFAVHSEVICGQSCLKRMPLILTFPVIPESKLSLGLETGNRNKSYQCFWVTVTRCLAGVLLEDAPSGNQS